LSIAGGVAAGASAPLAGATEGNKHKNNTRPKHPAHKMPHRLVRVSRSGVMGTRDFIPATS
jgi:hypothetical protein